MLFAFKSINFPQESLIQNKKFYLSNGIWQSWIHSGCSFSVKDRSLSSHNWLHRHAILYPNVDNGSVHRPHCIEQVLLLCPVIPKNKLVHISHSWGLTFLDSIFMPWVISCLQYTFWNQDPKISSQTTKLWLLWITVSQRYKMGFASRSTAASTGKRCIVRRKIVNNE